MDVRHVIEVFSYSLRPNIHEQVWPAFWTFGGTDAEWPMFGEIDIIEGINLQTNNRMSLHHNDSSCVQPANPGQTGQSFNSNCSNGGGGVGCTVSETKPNSYGESFAQNGGGAFALQFDVSGAFIWFGSVCVLAFSYKMRLIFPYEETKHT